MATPEDTLSAGLTKPISLPEPLNSRKLGEAYKKRLGSVDDPKSVPIASGPERCVSPSLPPETQFPKELRDAENKQIRVRRNVAQGQGNDSSSDLPDRIGLALSGGGIRSATFCLGVLQALAGRKWIRKLDYLSTVSGGGYVGGFLGRMFTREWVKDENPRRPGDPDGPYGPVGSKGWPADIANVLDIKGHGYQITRVESVLDDHRSTPMEWLRESGRYLSPTGAGDMVVTAAVAFRNWVTVLVVVITTLLAIYCFGTTVRALLWGWEFWRTNIEAPLMMATDHRWWWSPALLLPAVVCVLFTLPLGWAYWLTQKDRGSGVDIPQWVAVGIIFVAATAALVAALCTRTPFGIPLGAVAIVAALTLVYYAVVMGKDQRFGFANPSRKQKSFDTARNRLSRWFTTALVGMAALLVVALVDSFGQMAYALLRPDEGPGLKGFLGVTGLLTLFGVASRVKLLLDQLPDRKAAQIPISVVAGVTAVVLVSGLLVCVSAVANGLAWQWNNPRTKTMVSTNHTGCDPVCAATDVASSANVSVSTNIIPAINLSQQLHGRSRVELTAQNLIQVVDVTNNVPSSLACGMSARWVGGASVVCLVLAFFFGRTLTFLNLSSHQALYAARISRAYQGASNPERWIGDGQRLGTALPTDDTPWRGYEPHLSGGPLHVVNVTINETVDGKSQIEYRDRQGMTMALGPAGVTVGTRFHALWSESKNHPPYVDVVRPISTLAPGSERPLNESDEDVARVRATESETELREAANPEKFGYHPLYGGKEDSKSGDPEQFIEQLSLRQWVGISGAAFTTGLGKGTSLGKSVLLGLFNIRLGYWWDSYIEPGDRKQTSPRDYVGGNGICERLARIFPVQAHLFDEFLAKFRGPNSRLWYLSDGGHSENTAAYELIRRRVPLIIVCDCGCDPDYVFEDLGQLVRMVRVDFGAEIEFLEGDELSVVEQDESQKLFGCSNDFSADSWKGTTERTEGNISESGATGRQANGAKSRAQPHALLARVWYPGAHDEPHAGGCSLLIVLKPSLSGDEPLDVAYYKKAYPDFPQETTLDQFFDEAQWESYRKLGRHIGEQVFPEEGEPAWLTTLASWNA
jgi:hypothetical protein